jgi:hypothetical protein
LLEAVPTVAASRTSEVPGGRRPVGTVLTARKSPSRRAMTEIGFVSYNTADARVLLVGASCAREANDGCHFIIRCQHCPACITCFSAFCLLTRRHSCRRDVHFLHEIRGLSLSGPASVRVRNTCNTRIEQVTSRRRTRGKIRGNHAVIPDLHVGPMPDSADGTRTSLAGKAVLLPHVAV